MTLLSHFCDLHNFILIVSNPNAYVHLTKVLVLYVWYF